MKNAITRIAGGTALALKRRAPEILLAAGIAGTVAAAVLACRATLKADAALDEAKKKLADIREAAETLPAEKYGRQDRQKDLLVAYTQAALDFARLYAPAVALGTASIFCIVKGHGILRARSVAIAAAYKAVDESFRAYRKRVVAELGKDKDYIFRHGLKAEKVLVMETDEKGKQAEVTKTVYSHSPSGASQYAKFFDESAEEWSRDSEYNYAFLLKLQRQMNDLLTVKGHVLLNDVYDSLGLPRTKAGCVVGWTKDGPGDGHIDFGIFEDDRPVNREFVNGLENSILLDFNVDGIIWDSSNLAEH